MKIYIKWGSNSWLNSSQDKDIRIEMAWTSLSKINTVWNSKMGEKSAILFPNDLVHLKGEAKEDSR